MLFVSGTTCDYGRDKWWGEYSESGDTEKSGNVWNSHSELSGNQAYRMNSLSYACTLQ